MQYGICSLGTAPVFKSAHAWGQIVNQLLFGELFEVLETDGNFARIRSAHDGYEGWIDSRQAEALDEHEFVDFAGRRHAVIADAAGIIRRQGGEYPVVRGGSLPTNRDGQFMLGSQAYHFSGQTFTPPPAPTPIPAQNLANVARSYLNCPYQWGGRSPFGLDCSGFVQVVFKCFGVHIQRDAWQQADDGEEVADPHEARVGDVPIFKSLDGTVHHAGLLLSPEQIIHASSQVKVDRFDPKGIYSEREQRYTHTLLSIRRMAEVV